MQTRQIDLVVSALLVLFGAYIIVTSIGFGVTTPWGPGAGLFPLIAGLLIFFASLLSLFNGWRKYRDMGVISISEILPILMIVAITFVFIFFADIIGVYVLLPALFMLTSLCISRIRTPVGWVWLTVGSLAFTFGAYLVFSVAFNMQIPVAWFIG